MRPITKETIERHFGIYLIKVAEKQEYINDLLAGRIYMKESGYFRKLEDGYRGDKYDGKKPIDMTGIPIILEAEDGTRIVFNNSPGNIVYDFQVGFSGDDKVPIFCTFLMDTDTIEITGSNTFRIRKEYLEELGKFGSFICLIPIGEMIQKINQYAERYPDIQFLYAPVRYSDIMRTYTMENDAEEKFGVYGRFFRKDNSYRFQHEWRMLLIGEKPLIDGNSDHVVLDLGKFEYGLSAPMGALLDGEFRMEENAE